METKESVCSRLDKVLIDFFDVLSQIYIEQDRLECAVKSGYLNLSRARYNMGIKSVSIEQCDDNNMIASSRVLVTEGGHFELVDTKPEDLEDEVSDDPSKLSFVRRRNVGNVPDGSEQKLDSQHVEDIGKKELGKKTNKVQDPLKWFGILVPPALRQSQSDFKTAVQSSVSVAMLKSKLMELQKEYKNLLEQKSSIDA